MRRRALLLWCLAAVGVTVAGLAATRVVRSPQQALADAAPPAATTLTAPVERRVLTDTVVLRGLIEPGTVFVVTPPDTAGAVVTRVPVSPGEEVGPGSVLFEVSGRPVVVLPGVIPAYRDLLPGASGDDVAQLQAALAALGFDPGVTDGVLGDGTKEALSQFYASIGYEAKVQGDPSSLTAAEEMVRSANRAVTEAAAQLEQLQRPSPSEDAVAANAATEDTATATEADVAAARRQVRYAEEDLASAETVLSETRLTSGPILPMAEVVFVPELPVRVSAVDATVGAEPPSSPVTLEAGDLQVRSGVDQGQAGLLAPGMPVEIYSEVLGTSTTGELSTIGEVEVDEETGAHTRPVAVVPDEPLDQASAGQDVRLTVEAASTEGEVLVVPVSAIFAGADGQTAVLRLDGDGSTTRIAVTVGVSGDGYVEITPLRSDLEVGEQVVVGAHLDGPGSPPASDG